MSRFRPFLLLLCLTVLAPSPALASPPQPSVAPWADRLGSLPIQDGGRVMPLETYASNLAVQITGRAHWRAGSGPEAFSGVRPVQLLCDLMFRGQDMLRAQIIGIENRPFKKSVGLDPERGFFSATEVVSCRGLTDMLASFGAARAADPQSSPTRDQKMALELQSAVERVAALAQGEPLAIVPGPTGKAFRKAGMAASDPGTEPVGAALRELGRAYLAGADPAAPVDELLRATQAAGALDPAAARSVRLELLYNHHRPWRLTAYGYGLALVLFGISRLVLRRAITVAALLAAAFGVAEHFLGLGLRIAILGRAPVSNTYEALLWMGLIGIALGLIAQAINRRAWYLFAGLAVAELSVLFSNLVPLESQTGTLPAVLRSNYWLILHVLTIVASYGVLAVASLLGHVYLAKEVLFARRTAIAAPPTKLSHPLIVQTYRTIQVGVLLLTAGTILGGVWAADSWGRFWGWDPKETWALISIVIYFAVLHARYVRWLKDFGLAASAVLAFAAIVWTFYGVNYLMASGLHSYGFGSGGGSWVAAWAFVEVAFVTACKLRQRLAVGAATNSPSSMLATGSAPALEHGQTG